MTREWIEGLRFIGSIIKMKAEIVFKTSSSRSLEEKMLSIQLLIKSLLSIWVSCKSSLREMGSHAVLILSLRLILNSLSL